MAVINILKGAVYGSSFCAAVYAASVYMQARQLETLPAWHAGDFFKPLAGDALLPVGPEHMTGKRLMLAFDIPTILPMDANSAELFGGDAVSHQSSFIRADGLKVTRSSTVETEDNKLLCSLYALQALERAQPWRAVRTTRQFRRTFRLSDVYYACQHLSLARMREVRQVVGSGMAAAPGQSEATVESALAAAVTYCERAEEVLGDKAVLLDPASNAAVILPEKGSCFGAAVMKSSKPTAQPREVVLRIYYVSPPGTGAVMRDQYLDFFRTVYATWVAVNVAKSMSRL